MKKSLLTILCTLMSVFSWAQGTTAGDGSAEAYAVLTDNQDIISQGATGITYGKTLTFYYDTNMSNTPGAMSVGSYQEETQRGWNSDASSITKVVFDESFKNYLPYSTAFWFYQMSALTSIEGVSNLKTDMTNDMMYMFMGCSSLTNLDLSGFITDKVTLMTGMFSGCSSLTSLNVSSFNTENVQVMLGMFSGCSNLTSLDLRNFNTEKVYEMEEMFRDCSNLTSVDVSSFKTAANIQLNGMFYGCSSLTSLDLSSFSTGNTYAFQYMFSGCSALKKIYVGSDWNFERLSSDDHMFSGCTSLVGGAGTVYNAEHVDHTYAHIDGGTSNPGYFTDKNAPTSYNIMVKVVGNGEVMAGQTTVMGGNEQEVTVLAGDSLQMYFFPAHDWTLGSLKVDDADVTSEVTRNPETGTLQYLLTVSGSHSVNVTFTEAIPEAYAVLTDNQDIISQGATGITYGKTLTFYYDTNKSAYRETYGVGPFDSGNDVSWLGNLNNITEVNFNDSFASYRPTSTAFWFMGFNRLTTITGLENLNTSSVTEMRYMFQNCSSLLSLDLRNFNTESLTSMVYMFGGCSALTSVNLSSFNTSNVTTLNSMFNGCSSLVSVDVTNFNTENVTDLGWVFANCSSLTSLDLSSFNTEKVTVLSYMFTECGSLEKIYVGSGWSIANVTSGTGTFTHCTKLVGGAGTAYADVNYNHYDYAHIDGGSSNPGYFTDKNAPAAPEAYAVLSENNTVLTFYYDTNKSTHPDAMSVGPFSQASERGWNSYMTDITTVIFDDSFANATNITSTAYWFADCSSLTEIRGIGNLNTSNVTTMLWMFCGCTSLSSIDLSGFNTVNVTDMSYMFMRTGFTSLDLSSFSTYKVTQTDNMFRGCFGLTTIYVGSDWNTGAITSGADMFLNCSNLVGGAGTTYNANRIDYTFAHIDGGENNPGYFTDKNAPATAEAYAVLSEGNTILTFYYDTNKSSHSDAMSVGPFTGYPDFQSWYSQRESITTVVFEASFANCSSLTSTAYWFFECSNLRTITGIENLKTDNVTNMHDMFHDCISLTTLDVSGFNTANVTEINGMFDGCSSLTTLDLSGFNTGNVTSMGNMFRGCSSLRTIYAGADWSTAMVGDGNTVFENCTALVGGAGTPYDANHTDYTYAHIDGGSSNPGYFTDKNAPASYVITVTSYGNGQVSVEGVPEVVEDGKKAEVAVTAGSSLEMFFFPGEGYQLDSLMVDGVNVTADVVPATGQSAASYTLNNINAVHSVITYFGEKASYNEAYAVLVSENNKVSLTLYYDGNKSRHSEGLAIGLDEMMTSQQFLGNREYIQEVTIDSSFVHCELTATISMFAEFSALTTINDLKYLKTDKVTNMWRMFYACPKLTSLDVSGFNTANVTNMEAMFEGCSSLASLDVSGFNTANVTTMQRMFMGCRALETIDVSHFNTEKVTDMGSMFESCGALRSIDVSHFNTANVTNMGNMFVNCAGLTSLDVTNFNTSNVTNLFSTFSGCTGLTTLDLSSFNTAKVTDMGKTFLNCSALTTIYAGSEWTTASVTDGSDPFAYCTRLVGGKGTTYSADHWDYTYARIDGGPDSQTPGYFTDKNAPITVAAPEFRFEGDNLTMTTETQNAGIFYKVADLPSMDDAVVESVVNSLIVTADGQSTYYDQPFELKKAAVVKAIAIIRNETATFVSDTTTMVYDYEAWLNLKAAVESGVDLYGRAQGNPNVDTQLLEQLQWALNEGDMIYKNRAQMDSFEAKHFTQRINELCAQIEAQMAEDEPYAVLSDNDTKLTFYYDKKKATNNGMSVGPFRDRTESGWYSARKTITNVVFDDSFANCTSLTSTADWFAELAYLTTITGIGNLKTDNVTDMSNMFLFCRSLTSLDVTGFNTSNVTSMENMFYECSSLTSLDVSHFNTANVTNMDMMFQLCSSLTSLDVSNFNTSSLTRMLQMFCRCSSLKKLTLGNFNTDKVIVMSGLLGGCSSLTEIDLSSLNTLSVESLFLMFDGCTSLKTLDLSNFNTARVTNMIQMFYGCSNLKTVYVGDGWTTSAVTDSENMFLDCTSLVGGAGTHYDANHVDVAYAHIDGGSANPGYFTRSGDAPWVDPTEQVATPYFRMESDYNNEVAIKTDTDEAEIFYTQNSRMIQGNDTDFGNGTWNLNWKVSGSNASYQVTSGGYNNTYCLKLTSATASTFGSAQAAYKFVSALTKDTYYTLRFKARSESGRGQLQVFCQNDTIDNTHSTVDTLAIGSELADYEVTFKIQNEITNQIVLNFGAVADTYYIDNVLFGAVVSDTTNQKRTRFEQPINLREGATIKAVATKQGMIESTPAVLDYFYDGWMNLRAVYEMAGAITNECYGDPNVPLQMVQEVEVRVAERYYRLWDRRGREHVDDTELLETYDELRYILDELYRMKSGFTVDGVSYHAVDSTQVEVIPSLESYYRGAITVPATVNYNNINFRVTTVAQNAFRSEYLTAIFWYAGFALTATDLQSSQNPNLLLYVTEASMAPTDRDNVVINGFAKNIRLSEGGNFHCPQAFTAEAISYTREFKQQTQIGVSRGWETIALPFTVQTITHEQRGVIAPFGNTASNTHFWLRRLTSNGLQAVPTIEANTAYLISMPNSEEYIADYNLSGRVTFSAENATVPMTEVVKDESADYVMTPCFTNAAAKQGIYVLNVGEQRSGYPEGSIFESNYRAVLPFQAYVEHKGSNPAPPYFIVGDLGGDTTGIDATLMNSERVNSEAWYTLDGRKLQGKPTQKGVYITNGKKVIIK